MVCIKYLYDDLFYKFLKYYIYVEIGGLRINYYIRINFLFKYYMYIY